MPRPLYRIAADIVDRIHEEEIAGHFPHALLVEFDRARDSRLMDDTHAVWAALNFLHERIVDIYEESNQTGGCIEPMRDAEQACNEFLATVKRTFGLMGNEDGTAEIES